MLRFDYTIADEKDIIVLVFNNKAPINNMDISTFKKIMRMHNINVSTEAHTGVNNAQIVFIYKRPEINVKSLLIRLL